MSVHVSSQVWKDCKQSSERLLVMLAMADCADDDGLCWPSQSYLAERARITERGAQKIVDALIEDGEIELVSPGGGRGKSARYRLAKYNRKGEPHSPNEDAKGERDSGNTETQRANESAQRANVETEKGEQAVPPNRKGTVIEPSVDSAPDRPAGVAPPRAAWIAECARYQIPDWFADEEFDYYESIGWMSGRTPLVWKPLVRRVSRKFHNSGATTPTGAAANPRRKPTTLELEFQRAKEKTERMKQEALNGTR